jgi:hypothetical protein
MPKRSVNLNKYFDSKDYNYWLFILVLLLVASSTSQFGNNTAVLNYVSFAGTITSIILAVVAIIYSFFQNFANTSLNQKLIESADKIEKVINTVDESFEDINKSTAKIDSYTKSIGDATNKIDASTEKTQEMIQIIENTIDLFTTTSSKLSEDFKTFTCNIEDTVNSRFDNSEYKFTELYTAVTSISTNFSNISTPDSDSSNMQRTVTDKFSGLLKHSSYVGLYSLYFCRLMYLKKVQIKIFEELKELLPDHGVYMYGYIVGLSAAGALIIKYNNKTKDYDEIININDIIINELDTALEKIDSSFKDKVLQKIDDYFNTTDK